MLSSNGSSSTCILEVLRHSCSEGTGQNRVILHVNGPNELQSLGLPWQAFFITTNDIGT
jgi:hypothetical protein